MLFRSGRLALPLCSEVLANRMLRVKLRHPCGTPHFTFYTLHFTFFWPGGGYFVPPFAAPLRHERPYPPMSKIIVPPIQVKRRVLSHIPPPNASGKFTFLAIRPTLLDASPGTLGCNPRHSRAQPPTLLGATPDTFAQKCILSPCKSVYTSHQKEYTLHTRKSIHFGLWRVYSPGNEVYTLSYPESILSGPQSVGGGGQEGGARRQRGAGMAFPEGALHPVCTFW